MAFSSTPRPAFVDTPGGMVSAGGVLYRTSEAELENYAGPVLEQTPLSVLVRHADAWLESEIPVVLFTLLLLLAITSWPIAAGFSLLLYVGWRLASPSFPVMAGMRLVHVLSHPFVQGGASILVLSALAAQGRVVSTLVGLLFFVMLRFRLLRRLTDPLVHPAWERLYPLPIPDQVLRSLMIREALRRGVRLPEMDGIYDRVRSFWSRGARE